jgi:hypothetical protein
MVDLHICISCHAVILGMLMHSCIDTINGIPSTSLGLLSLGMSDLVTEQSGLEAKGKAHAVNCVICLCMA